MRLEPLGHLLDLGHHIVDALPVRAAKYARALRANSARGGKLGSIARDMLCRIRVWNLPASYLFLRR
eukprot:3424710-Prymnesium_polylepis.1